MIKIYKKSEKAIKEFKSETRSLNLRQRKLYVMIDGKRTSTEIANILNASNVLDMIIGLEKQGFIVDVNQPNQIAALSVASVNFNKADVYADEDEGLEAEHLAFIKTYLIEQTQMHLGLMGRELEQWITSVNSASELKSFISRWHMAIRESKNGRATADELMQVVYHHIKNPILVQTSQLAVEPIVIR